MYQTVVTNIQNLTEQGIPITMNALTAGHHDGNSATEQEQVNDATTTVEEDCKVMVMNGNQTQNAVEEES